MNRQIKVIVRGAGDLATGIICRLYNAGFQVLALETEYPAAIRRQVSFCEAVYEGTAVVEGVTARRINDWQEAESVWKQKKVPLLVDPDGLCIEQMRPDILIDAIIAKRNLGTKMEMAPLTIGIGPGFTAGKDVHRVIETMRGHNLGRVITEGSAMPNTGIPGNIGGYTAERVIHAPAEGILRNICSIGDTVEQGRIIAVIMPAETECGMDMEAAVPDLPETLAELEKNGKLFSVKAAIPGIIRGLIRDGYPVTKGFKIADIDPRLGELKNCFTISDKSRCIAGSVLEVICGYVNSQ